MYLVFNWPRCATCIQHVTIHRGTYQKEILMWEAKVTGPLIKDTEIRTVYIKKRIELFHISFVHSAIPAIYHSSPGCMFIARVFCTYIHTAEIGKQRPHPKPRYLIHSVHWELGVSCSITKEHHCTFRSRISSSLRSLGLSLAWW